MFECFNCELYAIYYIFISCFTRKYSNAGFIIACHVRDRLEVMKRSLLRVGRHGCVMRNYLSIKLAVT